MSRLSNQDDLLCHQGKLCLQQVSSELLLAGYLDKLIQTPWKPVKAHFSNWSPSLGFAGQGSPLPHARSPGSRSLCSSVQVAWLTVIIQRLPFFQLCPQPKPSLCRLRRASLLQGVGTADRVLGYVLAGAPLPSGVPVQLPDVCQPASHFCPFTPLARG